MPKIARDKVAQALRTAGAERGVAPKLLDALIAKLAPAVMLTPEPGGKPPLGGTRAGGQPDLPEGVEWPRTEGAEPMPFALQVNLAEVAPFDAAKALPAEGLLSFFFYTLDEDSGEEGRVLYFPGPLPALKRCRWPRGLDEDRRYRSVPLKPRPEWTLPEDVLKDEDFESWYALCDAAVVAQGFDPREGGDSFQLLGNPHFIQGYAMRKDESLLLQINPDYWSEDDSRTTGMMWGDGGQVYFILKTADLKAHAFDRLRVLLDMG